MPLELRKQIVKTVSKFEATSAAKVAPLPRGQLAPVALAKPEAPHGAPVVIGGRLAHVGDQPRRKAGRTARARMKFPIPIDIRIVRAMLKLPMVDAEIQKGKRLALLQLASACVPSLLSQNQFCRVVGVAPSQLIAWREAFAQGGAGALLPRRWNGGRRPKAGTPAKHHAFLDVLLAPASR